MKTNARLLLLACGLLLTLAFLVLSGEVYQLLPLGNPLFTEGLEDFRYTLRVENWGVSLALITVIVPWTVVVLYYYVINSVRFDRWWHWLLTGVIASVLTAAAGYEYIAMSCDGLEPGLAAEYAGLNALLSVWTAVIASFIYVVASYASRWWSSNCRHTPIPQ